MILIDKKHDYYDYLVGLYGIDSHAVYDRRNSVSLDAEYSPHSELFSKTKSWNDSKRKLVGGWVKQPNGKEKFGKVLEGTNYQFCLEVGTNHYFFNVERYIDDNDKLVYHPTLLNVKKGCKRLYDDETPISIIPCTYKKYSYGFYTTDSDGFYFNYAKNRRDMCVLNPILSSTFIPSFIEPTEIYDAVYNYIISTKEKEIKDNRTDKQKAESHGFNDCSFRKCK